MRLTSKILALLTVLITSQTLARDTTEFTTSHLLSNASIQSNQANTSGFVDPPETDEYMKFLNGKPSTNADKGCKLTSVDSAEAGVCKIDVFVRVNATNGEHACSVNMIGEIHTVGDSTDIIWKLKSMLKGDLYTYSFVKRWPSIPAILLTDATAFSVKNNSEDSRFVWKRTNTTPGNIYYLMFIQWSRLENENTLSGYCQIIDPFIAND